MAKVEFDWQQATQEASTRRAELRRQKWLIRRRELELIASKNFLLPRLDAVGRYRWRGFGDDLIDPDGGDLPRFDNAYGDLTTGDFQEWQLGVELSLPIGFRRAHAGVRNAELALARARAILRDQQREVVHELADAVAEMDRSYSVSQTSFNRLVAGRQQLGAVQAAYEADKAPLDLYLDAQRRLTEAESNYYRSLAVYAVATKNVHFVKGTLLEFDGVYLSEGPWPGKAYCDAADRESNRSGPRPLNYASSRAPVVGWGEYPQLPNGGPIVETHAEYPIEHALPIEHAALQQPAVAKPHPNDSAAVGATGPATAANSASTVKKPSSEIIPAGHATDGDAAAEGSVAPATSELPVRLPMPPADPFLESR
jgi:hypothetical protein